ncbi:MAG: zf-HC2 domain-containing protein [Deltaproteobacteria bacterium]
MGCNEIRELLSSYADGEARGDEGRAAEEHLAACGACRDLVRRMRAVGTGVERTEGHVPHDFRETLFARMEREDLLPRRRSLFAYSIRWAAVPLAAAAALALFVLTSRDAGIKGPAPSAQLSPAPDVGAPGAREDVARRGAEAPIPGNGTGTGGTSVADARNGAGLTAEEREIVAHLDLLEDPAVVDEPSEIDDLEFDESDGRSRG